MSSTAPQALERSVLERKERDELAAIAEAMGVKPAARASKATLIDQILREAGIETAPAEERPRRSRSRASANGAKAGTAAPSGDGGAVQGTLDVEAAGGAARSGDAAAPEPATPADAPTTPAASEAVANAQVPDASEVPAAGEGDAATPAARSGDGASRPQQSRDQQGRDGDGAARPQQSRDQQGRDGDGAARQQNRDQQNRDQNRDQQNRDQQNRDQQGRQRDGRQQPDSQGEPGNRRSRRRRGRDRSERDLQQDRGQDPATYSGELVPAEGLLDLRDEGYGFLRTGGYLSGARDAYVSLSQVRRFALRKGDYVKGASRPAGNNEKYPALLRIDTVNDMTPEEARGRPRFEDLTPLFPDSKLRLEVAGDPNNMIARIVDLVSPIGKGQRGLIVSPPKAGKTTVLKQIAHSIEANNPEVKLFVLLVDERPEEVTDFRRSVKGEVVASTFDRPSDEHTQVAELTLERAKRLVEMGQDVVIVLDGITRLSRAYNLAAPATGRIMSGGIDTGALYPPKRFFGAARNIEEGGSLTILATALVETGSKMDEVIFEEFKGTGNMELKLDRKLAERRIYPALDVNASSTRQEQLLFERGELAQVWKLRRVLNALEPGAGLELLMDKIKSTRSNAEFLAEIAKAPAPAI
ncbi:MAG TPA: transcription termination factor Rho [Acidimicrobiales bacterium]|nr:transcription termination factor Rho [Acidimicrobiales bacterium]